MNRLYQPHHNVAKCIAKAVQLPRCSHTSAMMGTTLQLGNRPSDPGAPRECICITNPFLVLASNSSFNIVFQHSIRMYSSVLQCILIYYSFPFVISFFFVLMPRVTKGNVEVWFDICFVQSSTIEDMSQIVSMSRFEGRYVYAYFGYVVCACKTC